MAEPKSLRPPAHDLFTPEDEPVAVAEAAPPAEPPPWTLPLREARLPEPPAPAREEFAFRRPGGKPVASAGEPESRERAQPEPRTMFDSLWPSRKRDQSDDSPPAVDSRPEPAVSEPELADEALPAEPAPVTVIKSGVIDGMAYSLFSDGSIEAELADGIIRFASIEELRAHLDRRN
ncbi:MAG: hypothetical protein EPO23_00320 [Xanthobacteraceae bacterium]|nr:MAG: hypothetical protein EPO23_00320 [Xanthobacteraceae bacterium]